MRAERQETVALRPNAAARRRRRVAALAELAERQHGVVSLAQLAELGVPARTASRWVESARMRRLHQGVFAVGHAALRREGYWLAAVLACGPHAVLSHRPAGDLHDLLHCDAKRVDVSVRGRSGQSRRGIRVHSGDRLHPDEVTETAGIPCTTAARTILDLAAVLDGRGLERLCERAARVDAFDLYALNGLRTRHRGRRGVARLARVLSEWDADLARTRSEPEVLLLRRFVEAGIERPVVNGLLHLGGITFEADFHWPRHRLIVETDSKAFHGQPTVRRRDGERDQAAKRSGWRTLRFNWVDVSDHPTRTLTAIHHALGGSSGR